MRAMVEIDIVRRFVDLDPLNRFSSLIGLNHLLQFWTGRFDIAFAWAMAIEAGLIGRHVVVARTLDKRVAVAAVETELTSVHFVREWHRLSWLVANPCVFRREIIRHRQAGAENDEPSRNG